MKPRRWWIAALLNLLGGYGAGYLYVGRPGRALLAAATVAFAIAALWDGLSGWLAEPWVVFAGLGIVLLLVLGFIVNAIRIARRSSEFALRWYNRWWIYLLVVLAGQIPASFVDLNRSVRSFSMPSGSMEPTLRIGEHFIVNMRSFDNQDPLRGDVVIFALPRSPKTLFVKRVIGLPGDEVQLKGGVLHLNGQAVPTLDAGRYTYVGFGPGRTKEEVAVKREELANRRTFLVLDTTPNSSYDNTDVFKVPPGHYFVLGDNRDNSTDSREQSPRYGVGNIPRTHMLGIVSWIYWGPDRTRIGQRVN